MASTFIASFLGALQASISVLLTLTYGLIAGRLGMVRDVTARDISSLCRNIFLPALLITEIGSQLNAQNVLDYAPIFVWAITYTIASVVMGKIAVRVFGLPSWTIIAVTFNNTTSLPLLLTKSLLETEALNGIAGGDIDEAVTRASSYFLVNSLVSKVLIFTVGPRLLGPDTVEKKHRREADGEEEQNGEAHEQTLLLPKPVTKKASTTIRALPGSIQKGLEAFSNPTTWGGIIAVTLGLIPALHRAAFAPSGEGGFLNAWVMSSVRNVGGLFSAMQIFVVGSKLSSSFDTPRQGSSSHPPKGAVITIIMIRFVVWGAISIPLVYLLAVKTRLLGDDPILWWCMMLMPVSPPAMILSVLLEVANAQPRAKMMVARMLAYCYLVTPVIAFAVVGALRATEAAQSRR